MDRGTLEEFHRHDSTVSITRHHFVPLGPVLYAPSDRLPFVHDEKETRRRVKRKDADWPASGISLDK